MVKDEVGNRYGILTVVKRVENDKHGNAKWECLCDCGSSPYILGIYLRKRKPKSCGCLTKARDLTAEKFGRLLVLCKIARYSSKTEYKWYCLCDCGRTRLITRGHLITNHTRSCGCYAKDRVSEVRTTHGLSYHKLYTVWWDMKLRCEDPRHESYELYSSKGRKVCKEWQSIEVFYKWAINNGWEPGLQLDREDNDKGYYPDNCRFITPKENVHNSNIQRRSQTGYEGVWYDMDRGSYQAYINGMDVAPGNRRKHLGRHKILENAVTARNNYIIKHNLPHKIQEIKE